jgi:hypothetical protein
MKKTTTMGNNHMACVRGRVLSKQMVPRLIPATRSKANPRLGHGLPGSLVAQLKLHRTPKKTSGLQHRLLPLQMPMVLLTKHQVLRISIYNMSRNHNQNRRMKNQTTADHILSDNANQLITLSLHLSKIYRPQGKLQEKIREVLMVASRKNEVWDGAQMVLSSEDGWACLQTIQ